MTALDDIFADFSPTHLAAIAPLVAAMVPLGPEVAEDIDAIDAGSCPVTGREYPIYLLPLGSIVRYSGEDCVIGGLHGQLVKCWPIDDHGHINIVERVEWIDAEHVVSYCGDWIA